MKLYYDIFQDNKIIRFTCIKELLERAKKDNIKNFKLMIVEDISENSKIDNAQLFNVLSITEINIS